MFCPTDTAVSNLNKEGFDNKPIKVMQVGDVKQDAAILFSEKASAPKGDVPEQFILATLTVQKT